MMLFDVIIYDHWYNHWHTVRDQLGVDEETEFDEMVFNFPPRDRSYKARDYTGPRFPAPAFEIALITDGALYDEFRCRRIELSTLVAFPWKNIQLDPAAIPYSFLDFSIHLSAREREKIRKVRFATA